MKKVRVLPVKDSSLESKVSKLRVDSFPYFTETRDFGFYESVYHNWWGSSPLAEEVHRWAAVTPDGEVVGHLSALPQYYRINGRRVIAHTPSDYMVHPRHGFQALSLMRTFFRTCENCVACDTVPATIGIETRLGAEVAGQLSYAMKLLNVSRLPAPTAPESIKKRLGLSAPYAAPTSGYLEQEVGDGTVAQEFQDRAPTPHPRLPLPGPAKGLLNGGLRAVDGVLGRTFGATPKVELLGEFDGSFDGLFERVAEAVPCTAERDAAFLRWRYGPGSPQAPVTVIGVKSGEDLLGYAVLKIASSIDGYILDLTALPGRRDATRALVLGAIRLLRKAGGHIIRYRYQDSPASARRGDLRRLGFIYRQERRNSLLTKFSDPDQHKVARHVANWAYTLGDGEAAFWMR